MTAYTLIHWTGEDPDDPGEVWPGMRFELNHFSVHEIHAGNPLHLLFFVLAVCMLVWNRRRIPAPRATFWYAAGIIASFVFFCALLRWQIWESRHHAPLFALAAVVIGIALAYCVPRRIAGVIITVLLSYALCFAVVNRTRALVPWKRVADIYHPRDLQYFADQHEGIAAANIAAANYLNRLSCRDVAVDSYMPISDSALYASPKSFFVYPLFAMINADGRTRRVWYEGVQNLSAKYEITQPHPLPCAVICLDCALFPAKWNTYRDVGPRAAVFDYIVIFNKDGPLANDGARKAGSRMSDRELAETRVVPDLAPNLLSSRNRAHFRKTNKETLGKMLRNITGALSGIVLCGILVAGLWPFHAPKNQVSWLSDGNGLLFGDYGSILSSSEFNPAGLHDGSCSIEIWLQPAATFDSNNIVAFSTRENPRQFAVAQSGDDLFVVHTLRDAENHLKTTHIGTDRVFHKGNKLLITITSSQQGTSLYLNGELRKTSDQFVFTAKNLTGELVIANSPVQNNSWGGKMWGLGIFDRELTPAEVMRHYEAWTKNRGGELVGSEGTRALYLFDEHVGQVVHNKVTLQPDLDIPSIILFCARSFWKRSGWNLNQTGRLRKMSSLTSRRSSLSVSFGAHTFRWDVSNGPH